MAEEGPAGMSLNLRHLCLSLPWKQACLPEGRRGEPFSIHSALFCEFTLFLFFPLLLSAEGYYVGRPMNYDDQKSQPPPATSQATGEQVNAQVPGACIADPGVSCPDSSFHFFSSQPA